MRQSLEGLAEEIDDIYIDSASRLAADACPPLAPDQAVSEDGVIAELLHRLPANSLLFSGNSLPIRQLDSWCAGRPEPLRILANRGASGIDGNVSTLLGLAAAIGRSDLSIPHPLPKLFSIYLLWAIGFKGGIAATARYPDEEARLREAMDADADGGVYLGTSGGHLFASRDSAQSWTLVAGFLPRILSVQSVGGAT